MDLQGLRVKDLNEICRKFVMKEFALVADWFSVYLYVGKEGIRTGGKKSDIMQRIQSNTAYQQSIASTANSSGSTARKKSSDHKPRARGYVNGNINNKRVAMMELDDSTHVKKQKGRRQEIVDAVNAIFTQFQDPESPESITDDGILAFCDQLGIDSQDPVVLVLSWYMEAETMCVFTRSEFLCGFEKLQCLTLAELREKLPQLRRKLRDREQFQPIYSFTFAYAKDRTQKSLVLDIAVGLWELLLPGHFPFLKHWLLFVKQHYRNSVSKDLWMQVLDFGHQIRPDLSNFDENEAWPVLLDDFVAYLREEIAKRGLHAILKEEAADDALEADGDAVMIVDE